MKTGKLYVVATPLGNLGDMSRRSLEILKSSDLILCEDTRTSGILLHHFGIDSPKMSYHKFNERSRIDKIMHLLHAGQLVSLISDAGTPAISDPGYHVVDEALTGGIEVIAIPGPSALTAALSISGFELTDVRFFGFFPKTAGERKAYIEKMAYSSVSVFYESPHRIIGTLGFIATHLPDTTVAVAKELTKMHERVVRGTADEVAHILTDEDAVHGEFVVVVKTKKSGESSRVLSEFFRLTALADLSKKERARLIAKELGIGTNDVYRWFV